MITIFSTCRSFAIPEFAMIQRNAIGSWLHITPRPQIILMGNDMGTKEFSRMVGVEHVDYVATSKNGVPLMDSMISIAEQLSPYRTMLFVSSDIILFDDVMLAAGLLEKKVGRFMGALIRHNLAFDEWIDFKNAHWRDEIMQRDVQLGSASCGDFFMFSKGFYETVPSFALGRGFVDFWMNAYALRKGGLIDLTEVVTAVHQNHGYAHVGGIQEMGKNEDFIENKRLGEGKGNLITHTPFVLKPNGEVQTRNVKWT